MVKLDNKDRIILSMLQCSGRISMSELAEVVNLSDTPCLRRVKKLEQAGVIEGYSARVNRKAVGLNVLIYAFVRLTESSDTNAELFEQAMSELDFVLECSVVTGSYDYLIKIVAYDLEAYESFVKKSFGRLSFIANIESTVVLKQTFSKEGLPLEGKV